MVDLECLVVNDRVDLLAQSFGDGALRPQKVRCSVYKEGMMGGLREVPPKSAELDPAIEWRK